MLRPTEVAPGNILQVILTVDRIKNDNQNNGL